MGTPGIAGARPGPGKLLNGAPLPPTPPSVVEGPPLPAPPPPPLSWFAAGHVFPPAGVYPGFP